jgi:hypothetical protein
MRLRRTGAIIVIAALGSVGLWSTAEARTPAAPPPAGTKCTWGGTPAQPTGTFTITPGVTTIPLAAPAKFYVTGDLAGDRGCTGTLTYVGQIDATGTCSFTTFEGRAKGIPTVTRFAGVGAGPLGPARLYNNAGNVVASENANVNTVDNMPHDADCTTPGGFTGGNFSSVIVFVDQQERLRSEVL